MGFWRLNVISLKAGRLYRYTTKHHADGLLASQNLLDPVPVKVRLGIHWVHNTAAVEAVCLSHEQLSDAG